MNSDNHMILKMSPRYVLICLTFALSTYYLANNALSIPLCIVLSLVCTVVALVFHILAKKFSALYIISALCNTVGAAFAVSIYYQKVKGDPSLKDIFILTVIHLALFLAVDVFISVSSKHKNSVKIASVLIFTAALIFFIVKWISGHSAFYSLGFFMTLISLLYVLLMVFVSEENTDRFQKYISFASFAGYILVAIIIALIILFILTEGEILEGIGEGLFEGTAELFCEIFEAAHSKKTKL